MKRTTLRTSAIALGVAAALPATAQEWNLQWGGIIHQHVAFGSTDKKTTVNVDDVSIKVEGLRTYGNANSRYTATVKFVESATAATGQTNSASVFSTGAATANTFAGENGADYTKGDATSLATFVQTAVQAARNGIATAKEITVYVPIENSDPNTQGTYSGNFADLRQAVADTNTAVDLSGNGQHSNTEVHFMPSITLDSGLTFGATIEFEGDKHGVDQSFISISSESLGTLKLGKHGKTGLGVHAPSVGLGINSGDHVNFIAVDSGSGAMSGTNSSIIGTADRISYTTPKNGLGGFSFGISFASGGDNENEDPSGNGRRSGFLTKEKEAEDMSDNIDFAMKFEQPFGDANFAVGMRYGTAKEEGAKKKPRNFGVGASVGFGGFTFGGSYADVERETLARSSSGWNLGASYNMDAWTFGIETYQGEADNGDDHSVSKIAASRTLGPGVVWDIYAITAESTITQGSLTVGDEEPKAGSAGAAGFELHSSGINKASGNAFGTAIKLAF
ncbi:MAG: porin [Roseovarius sp.]|nr:porin [Roseovarius sp.]